MGPLLRRAGHLVRGGEHAARPARPQGRLPLLAGCCHGTALSCVTSSPRAAGKYSNGFCHWPQPAWVKADGSFQPTVTHPTPLADPRAVRSLRADSRDLLSQALHLPRRPERRRVGAHRSHDPHARGGARGALCQHQDAVAALLAGERLSSLLLLASPLLSPPLLSSPLLLTANASRRSAPQPQSHTPSCSQCSSTRSWATRRGASSTRATARGRPSPLRCTRRTCAARAAAAAAESCRALLEALLCALCR